MRSNTLFLLSFICYATTTWAQKDTIFLMNGGKIPCQVVSINDKVIYTKPPDTTQLSIYTARVDFIQYSNGYIYVIMHGPDTIRVKPEFYLTVSGQFSSPSFSSYAYHTNKNYFVYADPGPSFSATFGATLYAGWGLAATCSYIPIGFDASAFISNASGILNATHYTDGVTSDGNQYLINYAYMLGITKTGNYKFGNIGLWFMAGEYITRIPAMQGIANDVGYLYAGTTNIFSLYATGETQTNAVFDFGIYGDIKIMHHLFFHTALDAQFSKISASGSYTLVDNTTGVTVNSGHYTNSATTGIHRADLVNIGMGLKYEF